MIRWADLKFPPINLWNAPKLNASVDLFVSRSVYPIVAKTKERQSLIDKMMNMVRLR